MAEERSVKRTIELNVKRFGAKLDQLYSSWQVRHEMAKHPLPGGDELALTDRLS